MARLNIEDCWWTDPRRSLLVKKVGSEEIADGVAVRMWRLAQQFWKDGRGLVPVHIFETLPHFEALIEAKLAEVRMGSVYVRGSSAYLDWVRERREIARENASKGGKASAESRKKKSGTAQPVGGKGSKNRSGTEAEPIPNEAEPNASVSGSISVSGSSSDSFSGSVISFAQRKSSSAQAGKPAVRGVVPEFEFDEVCRVHFEDVTHDLQRAWLAAYPSPEWIASETRRSLAWIAANPKKAPKAFGRFLNNWLSTGFEKYRKSLPAARQTHSQRNAEALADMHERVLKGEL